MLLHDRDSGRFPRGRKGLRGREEALTAEHSLAPSARGVCRRAVLSGGLSRWPHLIGGCAKIKGLDRFLSNRLGLPVSVADPFRGLYYSDKFFDPEYLHDMAPVAAVSVGLALRRMYDR